MYVCVWGGGGVGGGDCWILVRLHNDVITFETNNTDGKDTEQAERIGANFLWEETSHGL